MYQAKKVKEEQNARQEMVQEVHSYPWLLEIEREMSEHANHFQLTNDIEESSVA